MTAYVLHNISTHTPLAGRDAGLEKCTKLVIGISTHTPLAGRDEQAEILFSHIGDFYSHAPRGT